MFGVEKERLLTGLEALRKKICCYSPHAKTCDCKYGISDETKQSPSNEQTGCPELRLVIEVINNLTESQYNFLAFGDDSGLKQDLEELMDLYEKRKNQSSN